MTEQSLISVVDDDPSVRRALSRLLRAAGYDVALFESAEQFLAAASDPPAHCLILDVHLPGKSGLDLQAELVASGVQIPSVFITAFDDDRARTQAINAGTLAFLRKPLDSEQLLNTIQAALAAS